MTDKCKTCKHSYGGDLGNGHEQLYCGFIPPLNIAVALGVDSQYDIEDAKIISDYGCSLHEEKT